MAGYTTINARFRPYSYQELVAPIAGATEEHKAIADLQGLFEALAGLLQDKLANEPEDSKARTLYTGYMDLLKQASETLSSKGLNPQSRTALNALRSGYTKHINPIELASTRLQALREERRLLAIKDPTAITDDVLDRATISDVMDNPDLKYNYQSGRDITARVKEGVLGLASGKFKSLLQRISPQYYEYRKNHGYTPEEVAAAKAGQGPVELQELVRDAVLSTGYQEGTQAYARATEYALQGLTTGAKIDTQLVADQGYTFRLQQEAKPKPTAAPLSWSPLGDRVDASKSTLVKALNKDLALISKFKEMGVEATATYLKEGDKRISRGNYYGGTTRGTIAKDRNASNEKKQFDELKKKYGTNSLSEIEAAIHKDILGTSSEYKETSLNMIDPENVNTRLFREVATDIDRRLLDSKGKKIDDTEKAILLKSALPGYDFETNKLVFTNPTGEVKKAYLDTGALSNMSVTYGQDSNGRLLTAPGDDYINYILKPLYDRNPQDPTIAHYLNYLYDSMQVWSNTTGVRGTGSAGTATIATNPSN